MIQFDIGFKVDAKSLEGQLNTIHKEIQNAFKVDAGFSGGMSKEISNAVVQARSLEKALSAATTDKGLSFSSMNAELRKAGTNMNQVVSGLIAGGDAFKGSANEALTAFANANRQVITLNSHLQEMGRVFLQSMKFTVAQQAIQGLQNMLQESYEWVVDLDSQLTQIQIVSGKTAQQMEAVSAQIVERSRALRVAASDYAEASQIYYQQGLQDTEVQRRADITIKAAQAANESTKAMSDMLTAVWNTYNMTGDQLENAASVGAKLGAETAIEFRDIAEAMQISATAASQMGVSYNSLASIIATVGSTTRQSASVIGNAYKTIFNNFQRLKVDGENGEVTLKAASQQLQALGINLLDASGQVKDLDEVIMQAGQNWKNYSENEQLAIAQLVGGTRQFGQFLALMNNFDTYLTNLNSANMETGAETLEEQYSIAMESIEAKATNATEAWQRAFSNFYDTDGIKDLIDLIADLGNMTSDAVEAFGGLDGVISLVAAVGMTQLPKMFDRVKGSVTDFWDSLTPKRRQDRIIKDIDRMFKPVMDSNLDEYNKLTVGKKSNQIDTTAVRMNNLANESLKQKKQITLDVARAQDELNRIISKGTAAQATQAQSLKEELEVRQKNILAIIDERDALQKLQAAETNTANNTIQELLNNKHYQYQDLDSLSKTGGKIGSETLSYNALHKSGYLVSDVGKQDVGAQRAMTDLQKRLDSLQVDAEKLGLSSVIDQITELKLAIEEGSGSIYSFAQDYNKLVQEFKNGGKALQTTNSGFEEYTNVLSQIASTGKVTKDNIKAVNKALEEMGFSKTDIKLITDAMDSLGDESQQTEIQVENVFQTLEDGATLAVSKMKEAAQSMDGLGKVAQQRNAQIGAKRVQQLRQEYNASADFRNSQKQASEIETPLNVTDPELAKAQMNNLANGISQVTASFTMGATAANMFFTAIKEGNLNIVTAISSLGMFVESIQMMADGLTFLQKSSKLDGFAKIIGGGFDKLATKIPALSGLFSKLGLTASAAGTAGAVGMGSLLASVIAIAAPVAALIALFAFLYQESKNNSFEAQINRSTEATEKLKSATEEAKQEAENLKATIEGYNTAYDTLQNCVAGTEAWRDALADTNQKALDVLDTLSGIEGIDLSQIYHRDENGALVLDQEALERAQQQSDINASTLDYAAYLSGNRTNDLRAEEDATDISQYFAGSTTASRDAWQDLIDSGSDDASSYTRVLREEKERLTSWLMENVTLLKDMTDDELKDALTEAGVNIEYLGDNFSDYADQIRTLGQQQANNNEELRLYTEQKTQEILGEDYGQDIITMTANMQKEYAEQIQDKLINETFDSFQKWDWANDPELEKELMNRIRDAFGDQSIEAADNFVRGTDSNRSFGLVIDGQEKEYRAEELAAIIAASEALNQLEISAESASELLGNLGNEGSEGALKSFLGNNNLENVNRGDFEDLQDAVDEAGSVESYLQTIGSKKGLEGDELTNFIEAYTDSLTEALEIEWDDLEEELKNNFGKNFDTKGITLGVAQALNDNFEQIKFDKGSKAAEEWGKQFSDIRDKALAGITDDDQLSSVDQILSSITGESSLTNIIDQLESQGVDVTSDMADEINNLIEAAQSGVPVFEDAAKSFTGLVDVFKSLQENRQIGKDTYKEYLAQYGEDIMSEFFTPLGDGTHLLTKSADEFYEMVSQKYQDEMNQSIQDKRNQIQAINNLQAKGIDPNNINMRDVTRLFSMLGNYQLSQPEMTEEARQAINDAGQPIADIITAYGMQNQISADTFSNLQNGQSLGLPEAYREVSDVLDQILNKNVSLREQEAALTKEKEEQISQLQLMQTMQDAELNDISSTEVLDLADTYQRLAGSVDGYDESLKENEALAAEAAKEQLRFNQGLEDGYDKMEDWNKALKSGDIASYSEALEEMSDVYGNILDIDGSELSDSFKTDAENLDLLNTIMNGTEEEAAAAYDELSALAAVDLFEQNGIEDIGLDQIQAIQDALSGLDVGDAIDLEGPIKAQLDSIVNACRGDVDLINSIFSLLNIEPITKDDIIAGPPVGPTDLVEGGSIGVSEEVDNTKVEASASMEMTGMSAVAEEPFTAPIVVTGDGITNGGQIGMVSFPQYSVQKTAPETAEQKSEIPAQSYTLSAEAGGEGGLQVTNSGRQKVGSGTNPSGSGRNPSKGGKKGGGGGGGKKSTYKKPTPKVRYTNRTNQIDRTKNTVEKLAQVENQLYGKAKLAAMQKKSDLIVQQVKDYKALYDEAVAYREQDMKDLAATQLGQAVPMQIDAEGNILNQEEMDDYMREWKDRIDAIEDEGAKEAEQRAYDISEQAYTYYKEAQEKALEAMKEAVDQLGEWIQNEIEKRQYQMEIDIKVSDRQLSLLEFTLEELGSAGWITNWEDGLDNVIDQVDSIMNAGESTIDSTYKLIDLFDKVNNGGLGWNELDQDMKDMFPEDVWREANENGTLTNDILEAIGDNTETLLDYAGQLTEAWVSAWEKIGEAMDSYLEKLERARAPLDTLSGALDTFISIADSRGWDIGRIEEYNKLLDKQTEIFEANLEASQAQYQGTQEALAAMEPVYNDYLEKFENGEITGQQFDVIQEQYYNLVDANADAADQMYSDWDAYVSNLQEKFEVMSEQIWKTWNDKLGNMWNDVLESQEGFDMYKTLQNWYLDDFDKDYGLTTLTNQIEDAMSGITDPSRLKEYDAFMQEIVKKQEEGYNLSQGELDVLNAKFQLMQAQDAYEDARNNKNTMRLTRDASGNYSYVYSSEDTGDAEQQVLDAQKNVHDAEKAFQEESEANWYEYMLTLVGWMKDINWEMYENDEDYRRQTQEQWNQYIQAMNNAAHDVDIALGYTEVSFKDTVLGWITSCESMQEANSFYQDSTNELGNEVHQAWVDMDQKIEDSASLVMDSANSMEDSMYDLMGTIDDAMGNMMDTADDLAENMGSNMSQMIEDTASWSDGIIDEINAVIAKYKELYEMQTSVMQNHTGQTKNYEWHMDGNTGQWYYGDNNGGYYKSGWMQIGDKWYFFDDQGYLDMGQDRGDGTFWVDNGHYQVDKDGAWIEGTIAEGHTPGDWTYGQDTKNWGQSYTDIANGTANGSLNFDAVNTNIGTGSSGHAGGPENAHWLQDEDGILWYYGTNDPSGNGNQGSYVDGWMKINGKWYHFDEDGWLDSYEDGQDEQDFDEGKQAYWKRYAKGGYTGNQGLKGVDTIPAILAPGEYVLNHDDTTKILSAVQLLRGLSSGALAAAANAISKLANGSIPQTEQTEQIPVQQDVHIEATFPNVSVASEIEDALNNLVNETIQLIGSQNSRRL